MPVDESVKSFKVVYIPVDGTKPLEEQTVNVEPGQTVEAMTSHVKKFIIENEAKRKQNLDPVAAKEEKNKIAEQIRLEAAKNPNLANLKITDALVEQIAAMNNVDAVPLQVNKASNGYVAVNMYVDDQGIAKGLPVNVRASQVCALFGLPMQVLGDAWVARYLDNDDDFKRMDFLIEDFRGDWVTEVRNSNLAKAQTETAAETQRLYNTSKAGAKKVVSKPASETTATPKCGKGHIACDKKAVHRCARCKDIFYCSAEHQKQDWPRHKKECQPMV